MLKSANIPVTFYSLSLNYLFYLTIFANKKTKTTKDKLDI